MTKLRRTARRLSLFSLVALLLSVPTAPAWADSTAETEVRATMQALHDRIDAIVSDEDADPARKRALVIHELDSILDYGFLASAALGGQGERFSREQFAVFAHTYARFLANFFTEVIAASEPEPLRVLDFKEGENGRVAIRTAGSPRKGYVPGALLIPRASAEGRVVTYTLRKRGERWRVIGVAFGGVSVSRTFRGQLESFLKANDPDALVAELNRRNEANAANNPFAR